VTYVSLYGFEPCEYPEVIFLFNDFECTVGFRYRVMLNVWERRIYCFFNDFLNGRDNNTPLVG
jgi:hypothetical protein